MENEAHTLRSQNYTGNYLDSTDSTLYVSYVVLSITWVQKKRYTFQHVTDFRAVLMYGTKPLTTLYGGNTERVLIHNCTGERQWAHSERQTAVKQIVRAHSIQHKPHHAGGWMGEAPGGK